MSTDSEKVTSIDQIELPEAQQLELGHFLDECHKHLDRVDATLVSNAFKLCFHAHKEVTRKSGEPYYYHPVAVAGIILRDIPTDDTSIAAALLHDVVEDTDYTIDEIREWFGKDVAVLVDGVTKITGVFKDRTTKQAETFMKLLLSISEDLRVVLIKFADRLHNMRTLQHLGREKQLKIAQETKQLYAPLAHRFGLFKIKSELEDLCFKIEDPTTYKFIARKLKEKKEMREEFVAEFMSPIKERLQLMGFEFDIKGRPKHLYSIYRKMTRQQKPFEEIYDLFAIRIILDGEHTPEDCWRVYSVITNSYTPITDRLRDFISTPKSNGYRSLHTTVMTKRGRRVEVQIRTREMDEVAEKGLAAHWKYKEGTDKDSELDKQAMWLRELLESAKSEDAADFIQDFELNYWSEEIYVFTPKGDLLSLPRGATPLDFAFEIHTAVGEKAQAAKVNGKMTPLRQKLNSGDQVEIITGKTKNISVDWLNDVVTHKAKSRIRQFIKQKQRETRSLGREILVKRLEKAGMELSQQQLNNIAGRLEFSTLESLYYDLGSGVFDIKKVLREAEKYLTKKSNEAENKIVFDDEQIEKQFLNSARSVSKSGALVIDETHTDLKYSYAMCCNPIPGDDAIGFISKTGEVKIHRSNCKNALHLIRTEEDRIVSVHWAKTMGATYLGGVKFMGEDRVGLINDVTEAISRSLNTNIQGINVKSDSGMFEGVISLYVEDRDHLDRIITRLRKVEGMKTVLRYE